MKLSTGGRRLGATDAAKLLGVSKYGGPLEVYERVVLGKQVKANKQMLRGTREEPRVRAMYQVETGAEFMVWPQHPLVLEHDACPWATFSPDDITVDLRMCEYKTASVWAKGWSDGPPTDYVLQCQWGMWVANLKECDLFAAFGSDVGDEFHVERTQCWRFTPDAELQALFAEVGEAFWRNHILPKVPPQHPTAAPTNEASP